MKDKQISRREFLKGTVAATTALAVGSKLVTAKECEAGFDAKGLPTGVLGKTGVEVPLIGYGTGSRFYAVRDEDKALEMLTYALDNGLYYWDTANGYRDDEVISEKRLGKILKHRRKEVFLSTKVGARQADGAKRELEESLGHLQTDYIDLWQIHGIDSLEDAKALGKKGSVLEVLHKMQEEGVVKNIGFTGHKSAKAMAYAAKEYELETMLIALSHNDYDIEDGQQQDFENKAMPIAADKGMGVMAMKVIRPREIIKDLAPKELVRYALSVKEVNAAVISMSSLENVKDNIAILKRFEPLDNEAMDKMRVALEPFYRNEGIEWMQPYYRDGYLA